jgi:hypothetical protein
MTSEAVSALAEQALRGDIEALSSTFHDIYITEAKRQGDVRHKDSYVDLPENIKEFDRVLARAVTAAINSVLAGQQKAYEFPCKHPTYTQTAFYRTCDWCRAIDRGQGWIGGSREEVYKSRLAAKDQELVQLREEVARLTTELGENRHIRAQYASLEEEYKELEAKLAERAEPPSVTSADVFGNVIARINGYINDSNGRMNIQIMSDVVRRLQEDREEIVGAEPRRADDEWSTDQRTGTAPVMAVQPSGSAEMPTAPIPADTTRDENKMTLQKILDESGVTDRAAVTMLIPRLMAWAEREPAVVRADELIELCAQQIEAIAYGLECCDTHQEYAEAQIIKPLADKLRHALKGTKPRTARFSEEGIK